MTAEGVVISVRSVLKAFELKTIHFVTFKRLYTCSTSQYPCGLQGIYTHNEFCANCIQFLIADFIRGSKVCSTSSNQVVVNAFCCQHAAPIYSALSWHFAQAKKVREYSGWRMHR
jgi:hypothetical protein